MDCNRMTVTMEDGLVINFIKENDEVSFIMINESSIQQNEVNEGSIHAVVGEPLSFTYYYGYGSSQKAETGTPVKEIEYQ